MTGSQAFQRAFRRLPTVHSPQSNAWRWVSRAASWAGLAILGVVVAGLVFVALAPRLFGIHFIVVEGKSMEPTIHYGGLEIVKDTSGHNVHPGDIIEFTAPGTGWTTTHRVVSIAADGKTLTTRGDANNTADETPVPVANVHARYLFSIPHLGNFVRWLHSRDGYLSLVLVPGAAIILFELLSIARVLRKPEQPTDERPAASDTQTS